MLFHHNDSLIDTVGIGDAAINVFGGFNFVLGFLVVFRSQQAYGRWWEGGTLLLQLRGEWFNAFSCLVAFSNAAAEKQADVEAFQQQLVRLFSLLYCSALTQVSHMKVNMFELINLDGFDPKSLQFLESEFCHDKAEVTLQWIQRLIVESEQNQTIKIAPPILSRVYNELGNGIVNLNNARKIKEFPIPFPLAQIVMVMLLFHALFTPLVCAATIKTTPWAALITFVVSFCYWSVLFIALELEMPYGDDPNDLPLQQMARDMNDSLRSMLCPLASAVPSFTYVSQGWLPEQAIIEGLHGKELDIDKDLSTIACPPSRTNVDGAHPPKIDDVPPPKDDSLFLPVMPGPNPTPPPYAAPTMVTPTQQFQPSMPVPLPLAPPSHLQRRFQQLDSQLPLQLHFLSGKSKGGAEASLSEAPTRSPSPPELSLQSPGREAASLMDAGRTMASPADCQGNEIRRPESAWSSQAFAPQPFQEEFRPNRPACNEAPNRYEDLSYGS